MNMNEHGMVLTSPSATLYVMTFDSKRSRHYCSPRGGIITQQKQQVCLRYCQLYVLPHKKAIGGQSLIFLCQNTCDDWFGKLVSNGLNYLSIDEWLWPMMVTINTRFSSLADDLSWNKWFLRRIDGPNEFLALLNGECEVFATKLRTELLVSDTMRRRLCVSHVDV